MISSIKKGMIILIITLFYTTSNAQEVKAKNIHEFKTNVLGFFFGQYNLAFERVLSENKGFVFNIAYFDFSLWDIGDIHLLGSSNDSTSFSYLFSLTPEFRFYFDPDYDAGGHFLMIYLKYRAGKYNDDGYNANNSDQGLALGICYGQKWILKSGFVYEAWIGMGRDIIEFGAVPLDLRVGITLGWRHGL